MGEQPQPNVRGRNQTAAGDSKPRSKLQNAASLMPPPSAARPSEAANQRRKKVSLKPGHSALDWARLSKSDMRGGITSPLRVTREELALHNSVDDAWMVLAGRVYNITPYMDFHPGGVDELMRAAGGDGTQLFLATHSWVNFEHLLQSCLIGIYTPG